MNGANTHAKKFAEYSKSGLDQYDCNPLIAALPPIMDVQEAVDTLARGVEYEPSQRNLPAQIRQHALLPVLQFFQPLSPHLELERNVSRMIRFGYTTRNPLTRLFSKTVREKSDKFSSIDDSFIQSTSTGFNVIGTSGTGKTTAVNRVLQLYPQVIEHQEFRKKPFVHRQLVWLKLETPFDGSIKAICRQFFTQVDQILGTSYFKLYGVNRLTTDEMLPKIALVAGHHSLGTLVIDEIQHLSSAKSGGSAKMLNFFVELSNTMSMPILLIGTTKAMALLSQEFRSARRACGQGEMVWRPMRFDEEWEIFVETLWEYQYTKKECPLTDELSSALFDETQGIADFAVKIYMLAQIRAISTGMEEVNPVLIRSIAKDSIQTAQPFLQALRTGDFRKIAHCEDIVEPIDYARLAKKETSKPKPSIRPSKPIEKVKSAVTPKKRKQDVVAMPNGLCEAFDNRGKAAPYEALLDFMADAEEFMLA